MAEKTEVEKVRDIERAANPIYSVGNRQVAIVPDGYDLHDLEKYLDKPIRVRESHAFHDVESFIMYCGDYSDGFSSGQSRLFANKNNTTFTAAFDYNGWGEHNARYTCPLSDEWKIWSGGSGKQLNQQQFAQFIEDNLPDIYRPEGAEMLEISRSLEAKKNVNFLSHTRLRDGTVDFTFEEKIEATANKGKIVIPETFELFIPVYTSSDQIFVEARLRYRLQDGKLTIWYELVRPHKILDDAFQKVRKEIEDGLKVKALMGEV